MLRLQVEPLELAERATFMPWLPAVVAARPIAAAWIRSGRPSTRAEPPGRLGAKEWSLFLP